MKKILCVIFSLVMLVSASSPSFVSAADVTSLSELSDDECLAFLESYGVEIPYSPYGDMGWIVFIRNTITQVEANPGILFLYGNSVFSTFADDIKEAVFSYCGVDGTPGASIYELITSDANILQDNTLHGSWSDSYSTYNCYGYAIGQYELIDPGIFEWVDLGNEAYTYSYNDYANILTIANWTSSDLEILGYTVNYMGSTMPSTSTDEHTSLICVRHDLDRILLGYDYYGNPIYGRDYHFMRFCNDGYWYHKPGLTNPLRYNHTPSNSTIWTSEGFNGNKYYRRTDLTYDSDIYFIKYTTPHVWEYESSDNGQHIITCTICGSEQLEDCLWESPTYAGQDTHRSICSLCGAASSSAESCSLAYVYAGQVDGSNTHKYACTICGHVVGAATACTYKNSDYCSLCGIHKDAIMQTALKPIPNEE